jgi:hypothetical protein
LATVGPTIKQNEPHVNPVLHSRPLCLQLFLLPG